MKRFFTLMLGALAMLAVALVSAFITMRLAIHGREAVVPALTGMTVADASRVASKQGLRLDLENRFYSTEVAAGRVLGQDPVPGSKVRREWPVRVTESLGSQVVNIPDLTGESERAASVSIRRLSLDLGTIAHLAVPGDADVVLSQTPTANSGGVDGPRVSLLVSDPADAETAAYVMPSLVGLSYGVAAERASMVGLHVAAAEPTPAALDSPVAASVEDGVSATVPTTENEAPPPASGVVVAQWPLAGHRVQQGDAVHLTMTHPASPTGAALPTQ